MSAREQFAKYLVGEGIEIGACNSPFPVHRQRASVRYIDRLTRTQILDLFPEIPDPDAVVEVDDHCDLNRPLELVKVFGRDAFDFVIASHILEHISNPILALEAFDAILKPSGTALIAIPDNHSKVDRGRAPTKQSIIVQAYENRRLEVGQDDAVKYLVEIGVDATRETIAAVLARSFHIYSWTFSSFHQLLAWVFARRTIRWLLRDFSRVDGHEHIFLFEKTSSELDFEAELATALQQNTTQREFR